MAHFVLLAPPYAGHLNPTLAIAAALHARGQRATLLHTGAAPAVPEGVATLRLDLPPPGAGPFSPLAPVRLTTRRTASLLRVLPEALGRLQATALVVDQLEPAGALAAAALGIPWISVANALAINREPGVPPPFTAWDWRPGLAARNRNRAGWRVHDLLMRPLSRVIADWARAHGLPIRELDDTFSPLAQLSQLVAGLDFPRSALPAEFHYVGPLRLSPPPPPSVPRRLVFASLGTLQGHRAGLFRDIARAAQDCHADLLIAHGGRLATEEVANLPGRPAVCDFVPQAEVLAGAAALVGHGGMNTVMDALAAGVPAVLVPLAFEQAAIAARVVRAGAGIVVPLGPFRARRLRLALRAVLQDPSYRKAASVLQQEVARAGGAARAADIILHAVAPGALPRTPPGISPLDPTKGLRPLEPIV
jgi:zeaxanthin glucosyltransferase